MANVTPWAQIQGSLPPLTAPPQEQKPPATMVFAPIHAPTMHEAPDMAPLSGMPQPSPRQAVFAPVPGSLADEQQHIQGQLGKDYAKDLHPWGTPENHPGVWGKIGHAISYATGGPGRRQMEEAGLENHLEKLDPIEGEEELRNAQTQEAGERGTAAMESASTKENPPEKPTPPEDWTTLKLPTGDLLTGPNGKIIQQDKAGELRAVDLPASATIAPKQTAANSAFAQWAANPEKYEDFQKTMAEIKAQVAAEHPHQAANAGFMNIYAAQRFLQMAYTNNPGILPVASQMIGKLLNLSPEQTAQLGDVPEGQPRDEAGNPIGLHQPGAPTVSTRNRGQFFESVDPSIGDVQQQIAKMGDQLGPAQGRWMEVYEGKGGFNAPEYAGLRADLHNIATAWSRLHVNSAQSRQDFLHTLTTAQTPQDLLAGLHSIQKQGRDYELEGQGRPDRLGGGNKNESSVGKTSKPDGVYEMNGKHYRVEGGNVYAQ